MFRRYDQRRGTFFIPAALAAAVLAFVLAAPAPAAASPATTAADRPTSSSQRAADDSPLPSDPSELIRQTVDKVLDVLRDPSLKGENHQVERHDKIRAIMLRVVDMNLVSALTLSRYMREFSPAQLSEFKSLFADLLFRTYINNIENYTDEKVAILGQRSISPTKISIITRVVGDEQETPVDYSLAKGPDGWRVYDVLVEGVSIIRNYRTQFREILAKGKPEDLLKKLREKVKEDK